MKGQPARSSRLAFQRMAAVRELTVDQGDRVSEGQVLARLDTRALAAQRRELAAQQAAAQAQLEELQSGPRRETIDAARAHLAELDAERKLLAVNHGRNEKLLRERAISREQFDQTKFQLAAAAARWQAAGRQLQELENGTRQEQIAAAVATVNRFAALIAQVDIDLADSVLTAPFAGTIAERWVDEGTVVSPGSPILEVQESGRLEAWIGLPVATATEVSRASTVRLNVEGRMVTARLTAQLPRLDPATRTRVLIYELEPTAAANVVAGQLVRIETTETVDIAGFWVPVEALARGDRGLWSAYVIERRDAIDMVARRDVEVLHTDGERAFVRGTIGNGERLLATGVHRVVPGMPVAVQNRQSGLAMD